MKSNRARIQRGSAPSEPTRQAQAPVETAAADVGADLGWPLLDGADAQFEPGPPVGLARLAAELLDELGRLSAGTRDDPFSNPVLRLALDLSRRIEAGTLSYGMLEQLIQHLAAQGFVGRAARLGAYVGEADPERNARRLHGLVRSLAVPDGSQATVPFEDFRTRVEQEAFGIVITAHPTFNLSGELMEILTQLATGRAADGAPLDEAGRAALVRNMAGQVHRPDADLSLLREHALSLTAIGNIQHALRRLYDIVFAVAQEVYPDRWAELNPRMMTVASWVGYDLDGRSDIRWTDTLRKRLIVQATQLRHYQEEVRAIRAMEDWPDEIRHTLDLLESRIALAINELTDEIEVFGADPNERSVHLHIQRIARRMHEGLNLRLIDGALAIDLVDRAIRLAGHERPVPLRHLCVLRAELANYGLGMAHTHVRINSTQLHNAIRKTVGMETAPDDPRYRQSYLAALNALLDGVKPATINFGSILAERTSAKRLFMVVAQMLKYADATTPVRFLIAECESAFTALAALYYAKLFGVADKVDISPLFETEKALEVGSRIVDQLLENPHFRAYVQARGRLCIQTGYSDAGRYLGQTPAAASIERLKMRIARLFPKHGLEGVQLLVFDTHGESIGRGAHPASFADRLSYVSPPRQRAYLADHGIAFKQEVSFQGGDGYLHFVTPTAAFAVVTRILEHVLASPAAAEQDPFYEDPDYITEFFTTVKEFQVSLMRDPNYASLLNTFGTNLLYPSGSRAIKRQSDAPETAEPASASQIRAIPHNAILQQLGLPANTVAGMGEAIDKDPDRFRQLHASSARFRQLMGMVEYGVAVSCPEALDAHVASLDPGLWLRRAAWAPDRPHADELRRLAAFLEEGQLHVRQVKIWRKLFADFCILRDNLAPVAADTPVAPGTADAIRLLHAIRLAIMHEIFRLATRIPQFSSQHNTTHDRVIQRVLHLDVPTAVEQLRKIFPAETDTSSDGDFGEAATYVGDESGNYRQENETIFDPMTGLYELLRRCSGAMVHRIGFFG
ncbi:phosphoenolpyruvate carboxylase [Arenibaculum sp.]|uniref:phosphoenolpyruvate carboxylase n=1 Tax=Arenibaculum sp. TaxID=2865862 RepID=UPI002E1309DF|nr:phosphoenolpyruvate carboxylase [Arenibaculum sp.]